MMGFYDAFGDGQSEADMPIFTSIKRLHDMTAFFIGDGFAMIDNHKAGFIFLQCAAYFDL